MVNEVATYAWVQGKFIAPRLKLNLARFAAVGGRGVIPPEILKIKMLCGGI